MTQNHIPELIEKLQIHFPEVTFIQSWPTRDQRPQLPYAIVQEIASHRVERTPTAEGDRERVAEGRGTIEAMFFFGIKEQEFEYRDKMSQAVSADYEADKSIKTGAIETKSGSFRYRDFQITTNQKSLEDGTRGILFVFGGSWSIYAKSKRPLMTKIQLEGKISENPKDLGL